jgi:hypothetical protein
MSLPPMSPGEIRAILLRQRGSMVEIAAGFIGSKGKPVDPINVSQVLKGRTQNKRLLAACEAKAREILNAESGEAAAAAA